MQGKKSFAMFGKSLKKREARVAFSFISPVLILYTVFFWVPLILIVMVSFTKWDMFKPMKFVGLANYYKLFSDPYFLKAFLISSVYALSSVGLLIFFGLTFAVLFDRPGLIPFLGRMLFFMSAILPLISAGAIWVWITGPESYSGLNSLMSFLGMGRGRWLAGSNTALLCVIGFAVWHGTGLNTLLYTAGLRGIPSVYVDAARIDGASGFQIIRYIIIPLLRPITLFLVVTNLIAGFNAFTPIWFLTKGGPGTATRILPTYIYQFGFNRFRFGFASASAVVLIGIVLIFTYIRLRKL